MNTFTHCTVSVPEVMAFTQENGKRLYITPSGKMYPSITTVLSVNDKEWLGAWRDRVGIEEANKISRQASTRGTRIHALAEMYLSGKEIDITTPLDAEMFSDLKPQLHRINNIRGLEVGLYSDYLRIAGRVDCIAEFDGKLSVIDFKTARRPKDKGYIQNYFMQAAGYAIMFEERTGIPISQTVILIAVDSEQPQVFIEKRDNYAKKLLEARDKWELQNVG